jgi:hypothetical protein
VKVRRIIRMQNSKEENPVAVESTKEENRDSEENQVLLKSQTIVKYDVDKE